MIQSTIGALTLTLAVSCSPHKVTKNPPPPLEVPASFSESGGAPLPEKWWQDFGDSELDALVQKSLSGNFQLKAAWARLEQAQAVWAQAKSGKWPALNFDFTAQRFKQRNPVVDIDDFDLPPGTAKTFVQNQFRTSLTASYELDLWKRIGSQAAGAAVDAAALRDDIEAIAISLSAEIAEAWFDVLSQRAQKKLLESQIELNETFLQLMELRFQQGLSSSIDILQQRQQLVATKARIPLVNAALTLSQNRLSILVGVPPSQLVSQDRVTLPAVPPLPTTGVPADLLDRRPDVRAARKRVESADYRVAVAVADRLPALRIQGALSQQNPDLIELIATPLWSLLASVTAPIFDAGRRKAEVVRNEAVVKERLFDYGQALLQAMVEVENALAQQKQQQLYIAQLEEQVEIARATLDQARERYSQGIADQGFLQVLTALRTQQESEISLLVAQRQALSFYIQLCRALGGTWTGELAAPDSKAAKEGQSS
jgi:NodT family efflux transporter outer membrane factor (OMF) lipoprotein